VEACQGGIAAHGKGLYHIQSLAFLVGQSIGKCFDYGWLSTNPIFAYGIFQLSPSEYPTINPSKTQTVAQSFTIVPSPTKSPTLISSVTPDSEIKFNQFFSGKGPYLLYRERNGIESEQTSFVMLDFDTQGRKTFSLPDNGYVGNLESAISPDGKLIAYHIGSFEGGQKDLTLPIRDREEWVVIRSSFHPGPSEPGLAAL